VGVVGGHPLRKGYLYLLQAWKELALQNAQLRLRAGTEIYQFPILADLIRLQPSVNVVRYVPDIAGFYAECDAFILPSVDDGFGMALFEALANGVPSIATRNCGASELLVDERDALLIDAFSVEQIKQALLRLYESTELRQRLAISGPAAVAAFTEGDVALPYQAGIDRLLADRAAAAL
jgi:glycosyltransferase involved in cell wall biosynthesis